MPVPCSFVFIVVGFVAVVCRFILILTYKFKLARVLTGFTLTLNAVYGLTHALHWNTKWDYFVNLSASDLPLLPPVRNV